MTGPFSPSPAPRVTRERLLSTLSSATSRGATITLLRGPVGFGKTTLLRQWADIRPDAVWVTASPQSAAHASLWTSITGAFADAGHTVPTGGACSHPRELVERTIRTTGPVTLILDNVDAITEPCLDQSLVNLAATCPDLRVVLAGRSVCWFRPALLAHALVNMIGAQQLLFTADETGELLARALPYLAYQNSYWTERVYSGTGGWPAITAAVVHQMAQTPPDPVALTAAATETASESLRQWLIPELEQAGAMPVATATALTDRFSPELAARILDPDELTTLGHLARQGLLITDTTPAATTYQWPAPARSVLAEELAARDARQTAALHSAWANAYLDAGRPVEAVRHAVPAGDWPLLVNAIETGWRQLLAQASRARTALLAAPPAALASSWRAVALRELLLPSPGTLPGRDASVIPALPSSPAELAHLAADESLPDVLDTGLLVIAAHRHHGRHTDALEHSRRLLEIASVAHESRPADVADHHPATHLALGISLMHTGDIPAALTALEHAHQFGHAHADTAVEASAASLLALLHGLLGEVPDARRWVTRLRTMPVLTDPAAAVGPATAHVHLATAAASLLIAVDELDRIAAEAAFRRLTQLDPATSLWLDLWVYGLFAQARYALHYGDVHRILDRVGRARLRHRHQLAEDGVAPALLASIEAELLLAAGQANPARRCLRRASPHALLRPPAARLALLSGDVTGAGAIAGEQSWQCETSTRDRIQLWLIQAAVAVRRGDLSRGRHALDTAARAARDAQLRSAWTTIARGELDVLVRSDPDAAHLLADSALTQAREVYPPSVVLIDLTRREQAVLEQLAAGATAEQTAATLSISYNTVKTHLSSVYRKLGVNSRSAAVSEARRLSLIGT